MSPSSYSARAPAAPTPLPATVLEQAAAWKARADAGLTPGAEQELRTWLEADPAHRAALARFDYVWDRFDRPIAAGAADHLLQLLETRSHQRRGRRLSALAAVCLLISLGAGAAWYVSEPRTIRGPAVAGLPAEAPATPPAGAAGALLLLPSRQVLPDGSVAELKAGAEIAVEFSAELRRVVLCSGEVHFQVTKDSARPFVVSARGVEARAVGTAFTVQLSATAVEVLVTEGRVAVASPAAPAGAGEHHAAATPAPAAPEVVLEAGRSVVVDLGSSSGPGPRVSAVPPEELDERLAWRAPRVEFTRTQLAEAVAVLNGYAARRPAAGQAGVQFVIEDPAVAAIRVSGLFRIDRTEAFIGLLRSGFGLEAEPRADGRLLLRRVK